VAFLLIMGPSLQTSGQLSSVPARSNRTAPGFVFAGKVSLTVMGLALTAIAATATVVLVAMYVPNLHLAWMALACCHAAAPHALMASV
jgi:hypothetical protein